MGDITIIQNAKHFRYEIDTLLSVLLIPFFSFSQAVSFRHYKEGEIFKYRLTIEAYHNNKFAGKTISISEHASGIDCFKQDEKRIITAVAFK